MKMTGSLKPVKIHAKELPAGRFPQFAKNRISSFVNIGNPFEYRFVDHEYSKKFSNEVRIGMLAGSFAALTILISCLGLFGLSAFMAEQSTREIGIRKVLGASVLNVWQLLSKEFIVLIIISCFIAAPVAYHFLYEWFQQYEYRTAIDWWIFAVAGLGALGIALLMVSYQSIKAALMNPAKSIRTE
ncbi:FtsX-like permease family protein [Pseudoflavitalea sp. X16]|uniref:ABC transporter permease n=1 Tax=Paraflavitalea devenefica TaxID=2716334 RepID=UPI00141E37B3|nr:FtsX-like permease family protein [Paraflavitalea devenefica]NII26932.1 FtsX-like permease family protein [Paraflavitalea devenefica]